MTIRLKTVCPEQIGPLPDGEYEVPSGCTAAGDRFSQPEIRAAPRVPGAVISRSTDWTGSEQPCVSTQTDFARRQTSPRLWETKSTSPP